METNRSFWDFSSRVYDTFHSLEKPSYKKVADNIAPNIKPGDSILELACGTGILSEMIFQRCDLPFLNYVATDFSQKMIDICRRKTDRIDFRIADATNLKYQDESFDHIIIANALHIMPHPKKALSEVHRVLKSDGILFAPNFLAPKTTKETLILDITKSFGYKVFNSFELENYLSLLESNGFKVTKEEVYTCFRRMFYVSCCKQQKPEIS